MSTRTSTLIVSCQIVIVFETKTVMNHTCLPWRREPREKQEEYWSYIFAKISATRNLSRPFNSLPFSLHVIDVKQSESRNFFRLHVWWPCLLVCESKSKFRNSSYYTFLNASILLLWFKWSRYLFVGNDFKFFISFFLAPRGLHPYLVWRHLYVYLCFINIKIQILLVKNT